MIDTEIDYKEQEDCDCEPTELQILNTYCKAHTNEFEKKGMPVMCIPVETFKDMTSTLNLATVVIDKYRKMVHVLQIENEAIRGLRTQLVNLARKQGTMETGILMVGDERVVIPGFNGPRPEHAYLSRDTMKDVLVHGSKYREKREKRNGKLPEVHT